MQEYFEGVERARTLLREDLITEEKTLPTKKKYPRSFISDAICEYSTERNKQRKAARKRQKAGRRKSRRG